LEGEEMKRTMEDKPERGWWTLNIEGIETPDDSTLEHIAKLIKEGYTSGEIIQEPNVN
jgi:hypothetical protein